MASDSVGPPQGGLGRDVIQLFYRHIQDVIASGIEHVFANRGILAAVQEHACKTRAVPEGIGANLAHSSGH